MKPFDLEAAKAGAKVVCGNGMPARIICFDARGYGYKGNLLIALVSDSGGDEVPMPFTPRGECLSRPPVYSLRMAPTKREGWVNAYPDDGRRGGCIGSVWVTREAADAHAIYDRIACVHVEWEE